MAGAQGPAALLATFAVVLLGLAAVAAVRLVLVATGRGTEPDIEASHVLMGVAMAGMFRPALDPFPRSVWFVVFGVVTGWFGIRAARGAPCGVPHVVAGAAMLYMYALDAGGMHGEHGGAGTARLPVLALLGALFLFGYAVLQCDRLVAPAPAAAVGTRALAPRVGTSCMIVMCVSMGYMLVTML